MYFIILLIVVIILFFKNIETFTNSEYVIIGDNTINMQNYNILVLNDINWKKDIIDIKMSNNITVDLIYTNNNFTMNSSGSINRYYNSNELKQIIIKKKYLSKSKIFTDYYSTDYYPMSDYYYPMSYPRIPHKRNNFRKHH